MRAALGSRPVQFALLGGAIFFVSSRVQRAPDTLAFTRAELSALRDDEARRKGLGPNASLQGDVDERAFEDEILYREGLALGFDRNDSIVRQRVIQKTLFLAEELAGASEPPTDAELRAYFEQTRARWRRPETFRFVHVFAHDRSALEAIPDDAPAQTLARLGEASPLPHDASMTGERLSALLGDAFVQALPAMPRDVLGPPVASALGWHRVRLLDHVPSQDATFDEVKDHLRGAYVVERRQQAVQAYLDRSFQKYRVTLDGARVAALHPSGRVAPRKSSSAED